MQKRLTGLRANKGKMSKRPGGKNKNKKQKRLNAFAAKNLKRVTGKN